MSILLPISAVTENMKRAQRRNAIMEQKLLFRKGISTCKTPQLCKNAKAESSDGIVEMTINEIINGKADDDFPGLVPLIRQYLDGADVDVDTRCTVSQYLSFIQKRASGELQTLATWMRAFIGEHPEYGHDSFVSDRIVYDMLKTVRIFGYWVLWFFEPLLLVGINTSHGVSAEYLARNSIHLYFLHTKNTEIVLG
ncbi:unnamed protein product [Gongylonema pulchrum]|uniref:Glutamate--cysteine ligase n=1 Tax=Gongylonema pulchrum TaxID=637853 RepID=A0A3P6QQD5_9BILA|nr:unnamed protein product [Gongylonema pulchrum]